MEQEQSSYIVIDKSTDDNWKHALIMQDEDGNNKIFDTVEEAQEELEKCQNGMIVGSDFIPDDTPDLIRDIYAYLLKYRNVVAGLSQNAKKEYQLQIEPPSKLLKRIEQWNLTL